MSGIIDNPILLCFINMAIVFGVLIVLQILLLVVKRFDNHLTTKA